MSWNKNKKSGMNSNFIRGRIVSQSRLHNIESLYIQSTIPGSFSEADIKFLLGEYDDANRKT